MATSQHRAAVQVNIVGRDGTVGPPVFVSLHNIASDHGSIQSCHIGRPVSTLSVRLYILCWCMYAVFIYAQIN